MKKLLSTVIAAAILAPTVLSAEVAAPPMRIVGYTYDMVSTTWDRSGIWIRNKRQGELETVSFETNVECFRASNVARDKLRMSFDNLTSFTENTKYNNPNQFLVVTVDEQVTTHEVKCEEVPVLEIDTRSPLEILKANRAEKQKADRQKIIDIQRGKDLLSGKTKLFQ